MADTGTTVDQASTETTTTTEATTTDPYAGLPEEFGWLKSDLESTRREAAGRRVELRDLQDKFKDAKTPEEFSAAIADASARSTQLEAEVARERAARKHKLDDSLIEFLTGTDEASIMAQAEKLAALATKPAAPHVVTQLAPTGGVNPSSTTPPDLNGREAWQKFKGRR